MSSKLFCTLILTILLFSCTNKPVEQQAIENSKAPHLPPNISASDLNNRIALVIPLSGNNQNLGNAILDAAYLALIDNNNKNSVIVIDSAVEKKQFINEIKGAIKQGVKIFVGPVFAEDTKLLLELTYDSDVIILSFSNDSSLSAKNLYLMGFVPENAVEKITNYASSKNISDFYTLLPKGKYASKINEAFSKLSNKYHISLINSYLYQKNISSIAKEIKMQLLSDPNNKKALIIAAKGKELEAMTNIIDHNYLLTANIQLINLENLTEEDIGDGSLDSTWYLDEIREEYRDFDNIFKKQYPRAIFKMTTIAYDAMSLAANIKSHHNLTSEHHFKGLNGNFHFNEQRIIQRDLHILQIDQVKSSVISNVPR